MRSYIAAALGAGAVLTLVLIVAAALWGLLAAAGDAGFAQGVKGVAAVALVCWVLDFIALVVLLAVGYLSLTEHESEEGEGEG